MAASRSTTSPTRKAVTSKAVTSTAPTSKVVTSKAVTSKAVTSKAVTSTAVTETARPARAPRRRGRAARPVVPVALGSLTQPGARDGGGCAGCGSIRVTSLTLTLTDGTPVQFTSCHSCEHRTWVGPDGSLDRQTVLDRTRKVR